MRKLIVVFLSLLIGISLKGQSDLVEILERHSLPTLDTTDSGVVVAVNDFAARSDLQSLAAGIQDLKTYYLAKENALQVVQLQSVLIDSHWKVRDHRGADSLLRENLKLVEDYGLRSKILLQLSKMGWNYIRWSRYQLADSVLSSARSMMDEGLTEGADGVFLMLGLLNSNQGHDRRAVEFYKQSLKYTMRDDSLAIARVYKNMAFPFSELGQFDSASKYTELAISIFTDLNRSFELASSFTVQAVILMDQGQYTKSVNRLGSALILYDSLNSDLGRMTIYNELGLVYLRTLKLSEAEDSFERALALSLELNHARFESIYHNNLAKLWILKQNFNDARDHLNSSLVISRREGLIDQRNQSEFLIKLIDLWEMDKIQQKDSIRSLVETIQQEDNQVESVRSLYMIGELAMKSSTALGLSLIWSGIHLSRESQLSDLIIQGHQKLNEQFYGIGNIDSAYYHLRIVDSLQSYAAKVTLNTQLAEVDKKLEMVEKETLLRKREGEILKLESKQQRLMFWFVVSVLLAVILLVVFGWWLSIKRAKKWIRLEMEANRRQFAAVEKERQRFAQDLHDGLGQRLLVIKNFQTKLPSEERSQYMDETIDEMRRISRNLFPVALEKLGLIKAVESALEEVEVVHGIITHLETNLGDEEVSSEKQLILFRTIQEAVSNAIKHSNAKAIRVDIELKDGFIETIIRDNGTGFDMSSPKSGVGLESLRRRIESLGGKLKVYSSIESGTRLTLVVLHEDSNQTPVGR